MIPKGAIGRGRRRHGTVAPEYGDRSQSTIAAFSSPGSVDSRLIPCASPRLLLDVAMLLPARPRHWLLSSRAGGGRRAAVRRQDARPVAAVQVLRPGRHHGRGRRHRARRRQGPDRHHLGRAGAADHQLRADAPGTPGRRAGLLRRHHLSRRRLVLFVDPRGLGRLDRRSVQHQRAWMRRRTAPRNQSTSS